MTERGRATDLDIIAKELRIRTNHTGNNRDIPIKSRLIDRQSVDGRRQLDPEQGAALGNGQPGPGREMFLDFEGCPEKLFLQGGSQDPQM
ncbi:MAG: hypothetical protein Q7U75_14220, partial [Desulfobacterales bacterium]|nr:hypothetical protein [Desulfobacterales bacterium]